MHGCYRTSPSRWLAAGVGRGLGSALAVCLAAGFASALAVCLAAGFAAGAAHAAPCSADGVSRAENLERPRFRAEVSAAVQGDSTCALLHIEVPYSELCFRKEAGGYGASFDLIVHVFEDDRPVAGDVWSLDARITDRSEARRRGARFEKDIVFRLPPGQYAFDVRLSEPSSGHEGRLCLGGRLPARVWGRPMLSDILLGACGADGDLMDLRQAGFLRREFSERQDTVCVYAELYHRGLEYPVVDLSWRLSDSSGETVREGSRSVTGGRELTSLSWPVPVADLWLDAYRVAVEVRAGAFETRAETSVSLLAESPEALSRFLNESIEVLALIAEDSEIDPLRNAPSAERREAWHEFWKKRDPTPESPLNEFKEEFFRRVHFANRNFGILRPGWQTDRGEIYITHGDPDEITRDPHSYYGRTLEVWFYDRLGRRFVFVDRNGYGDFELVQRGW